MNYFWLFLPAGDQEALVPCISLTYKPFIITTVIHTDQRYIQALLENDTLAVREIYSRYAGKVRAYILANSGSEDDAADIFQESLIDIYNQAKNKGLQLTCPFEPFLIIVCKRKWLNELKKRGRQPVTKEVDDVSIGGRMCLQWQSS